MNASQLEVVEATDSQKADAFRQVFDVWPCGATVEQHLQRRLASVQHARATWYVGCLAGRVACSLGAYALQAQLNGEPCPAFAIGSVHTAAEFRGRGFAPQLLRGVEQIRAAAGEKLAMLFSDIPPSYYARLGYQACPSHRLAFAAGPQAEGAVSLTVSEAGLSDDIKNTYAQDVAQLPFFIVRDRSDDWTHLEARVPSPTFWCGVQLENVTIGSVRLAVNEQAASAHLIDYAFGDTPDDERFWPLLADVLGRLAASKGVTRVGGWAPWCETLATEGRLEQRPDEITMIKPLSDAVTIDDAVLKAADWLRETDHV